jgi:hypothetical protein
MRWRDGRFEAIQVPTQVSVLSLRQSLKGDGVVAVNQVGDVMSLARGSATMVKVAETGLPLVSAVERSDGSFVGVGFLGVSRVHATASSPSSIVKARS